MTGARRPSPRPDAPQPRDTSGSAQRPGRRATPAARTSHPDRFAPADDSPAAPMSGGGLHEAHH